MKTIARTLIITSVAGLAACASPGMKEVEKPRTDLQVVEEKVEKPVVTAVTEGRGADTTAIGGAYSGHPLDNPASPLSTRVIYFEYDSSVIQPNFRPVVEAHAKYIAANPGAVVKLEGHADERGSREYNVALGERRAQSVNQVISLTGAGRNQVSTVSYGEERPVALGHDEGSWYQNRRVEIIYTAR